MTMQNSNQSGLSKPAGISNYAATASPQSHPLTRPEIRPSVQPKAPPVASNVAWPKNDNSVLPVVDDYQKEADDSWDKFVMQSTPMAAPTPRTIEPRQTRQNIGGVQLTNDGGGEMPVPKDLEAEAAVIGALLIDRDTILDVQDFLLPEHFFSDQNAAVYRAVLGLYEQAVPADLITVRDELRKLSLLGSGEGQVLVSDLAQMMRSTATPVHVRHYARIVRERSLDRRHLGIGAEIVALGFNEKLTPVEKLNRLDKLVRDTGSWWGAEDTKELHRHQDAAQAIAGLGKGKTKVRFQLPWKSLNGEPGDGWMTPGVAPRLSLSPMTMTVIMGKPGSGKTTAIEQIADSVAMQGGKVAFCHNELSRDQLIWRRICRMQGIGYWKFDQDCLSTSEQAAAVRAVQDMEVWPGQVDFVKCKGWSGWKLANYVRKLHTDELARTGSGYDLIIWDYLHRAGMPENAPHQARYDTLMGMNVTEWADLANELNVHAILGSQINREGRDDPDKLPTMESAKDCGAIEERGNNMVAIHRKKDLTQFIGLKNSFGSPDWVAEMEFVGSHYTFKDI